MDTTTLTEEIPAFTLFDRLVTLPAGAEIQMSAEAVQELKRTLDAAGKMPVAQIMVRCPGAKNPAPYTVSTDRLALAVSP